jgi:hypothetical protein
MPGRLRHLIDFGSNTDYEAKMALRAYHGEFEVHMTVGLPGQGGRDQFLDWCRIQYCKFVHIVLVRGDHVDQPMATWRRSQASLTDVLAEARAMATELEEAAFSVVRVKVEADTLNQDVPQLDEEAIGHAAVRGTSSSSPSIPRTAQICGITALPENAVTLFGSRIA